MPGGRYGIIAAAEPYLASLVKWTKRGGLCLLALAAFGLTMDWLEPRFWVEDKARIAEEDRLEALAEREAAD